MSGIDFARSDLSPGLLCELVLKDEFTFQIPALEIFPITRGGALLYNRGYGCASGIFKQNYPFADQNFGNILDPFRQMVEHFQKYIPYFLGLPPLLGLSPP